MNNLIDVHNFLQTTFKEYVSIIAIGSIAVGDKWVEGRSDRDILIVFNDFSDKDLHKVRLFFSSQKFDDTYMFVPIKKVFFLENKKHSHDFSGKFRSKTLFGEDIIPHKQLPSKEESYLIYTKGLEDIKRRILRSLVNESFWSEKKVRDIFRREFKHGLMFLAIKEYCDNGIYPKSRDELIIRLNETAVSRVLDILNNINEVKKENIIDVASDFQEYLNNLNLIQDV